jgi:predicted nucleic acid-binding protein
LIAYADTGFLISLYREDDHSATASALVRSKPVFLLTPLVEAEFTNALQLAVFRKRSTLAESRLIYESFTLHQASGVFRAMPLGSEVWEKTAALSRRHTAKLGVRTLDVIHVAAALVLKPDVFFSFDDRQRKLARAARLQVLPA